MTVLAECLRLGALWTGLIATVLVAGVFGRLPGVRGPAAPLIFPFREPARCVPLQEICDVLLVDLKERYLDLAIRLQILPLRETVIDVVEHSLNYALISALNHHVSSDLRDAGPVVDPSD